MQLHGLTVRLLAGLAVLGITLSGCRNMNHAQKGTALGAGAGTLIGAIIGHQTGDKEIGALIGAGTGAVAGHVIGHSQDMQEERDAAVVQAYRTRRQQQAAQRAVTNQDVISMTQQGLPEQIIINSFTERGARFDLSPEQLGYLHNSGVSDNVLTAMQRYNSGRY